MIQEAVSALLISLNDGYECSFAGSAAQARECMAKNPPALIICDLTLPDVDGVSLIRELRQTSRKCKIIVYSMHDEVLFGTRCIRSGANGYVMKDAPIADLRLAIQVVMTGKVYASDALAGRLMSSLHEKEGAQADPSSLTDREFDIFHLIGQGLTTREIALQLDRSVKTIETHRENIKVKLNLANATELLLAARDHTNQTSTAKKATSVTDDEEVSGRSIDFESLTPEDFFEDL